MIEARSEVLKLRAKLKHTEEERDIQKKMAARYFVQNLEGNTALSRRIGRSMQCE